ncbi:MAG TPA: hypothetical protein VFA44_12100 [Gaiellaceae bacterium]|nr:hypothetical protein [Gaiellaceae bacterium]
MAPALPSLDAERDDGTTGARDTVGTQVHSSRGDFDSAHDQGA